MKTILKYLIAASMLLAFGNVKGQGIKIMDLPILTSPDSSIDWVPTSHYGTTYRVKVGKLFHEFGGSGGGSGTPGGSDTHIQYNNSGAFAGSADFTWNQSTGVFQVGSFGGGYENIFKADGSDYSITLFDYIAGLDNGYGAFMSQSDGICEMVFGNGIKFNELLRIADVANGYEAGAVQLANNGGNVVPLQFLERSTNGLNYVGFKAPDAITTSQTYIWPSTVGSAGSVLVDVDGAGTLAWGGVAGAVGSDGEIQYNDGGGGFAASPDFTFDDGTNTLGTVNLFTQSALFNPNGTSTGNTGEIRFSELTANGSNYVGFKSPDSRSANLIYTLPSTDPTSGQVLSAGSPSGGVSALSWATPSSPGDAAADASTKGVATFAINDFNSSAGLISIDYTNGQAATTSAKGFLTDTDWDTFNGKLGVTTTGTTGQTLYYAGAGNTVTPTSNLFNDGTDIFMQRSTGEDFFQGSPSTDTYAFGDIEGYLNGTDIIINDDAQTISLNGNTFIQGDFDINGNVTNGTWTAAVIDGQYGGTGVANTGKTITLGGNLTTSGANALTFTTVGATNVTLPTSGTLVTSGVTTLSSLTSVGTITTGVWNGTAIANANLANSSTTINGTAISLGASGTVTAAAGTLTGTTLNSSVVTSSLTSVGTIGTGTWQGSVLAGQYGGTGVANTGKTITVSGNTTIGSSTNTVAFATSGNTSVTLPTSGTLATLAGTETLTGKSIVATQLTGTSYTFGANNTSGTAAYTLQPYEDHPLATYAGTVTFNSTPPSSITVQQYAWSRIGNTVTLFFSIFYGTPGTTNTSAIITLPSDCPAPVVFANAGDAASEYIFPVCGARVEANMTGNPSAIRGGLRQNSSNNGYEVALIFGSVSAAQCQFTISYRTN